MEEIDTKRGKKLYYYLSRFSDKELKDFYHYLNCPLLGNSPQFARMLLSIQEKVLGTERSSIDADIFQEEFFPGQSLDEGKQKYIRIRLVQMHDKLLDFLSFIDYREDPNAKDIHLLKALHTRGWDKYFVKLHEKIDNKPPFKKAGEYHIYRLWRAIVLNDYLTEMGGINGETGLGEVVERMEVFCTHVTLKYHMAIEIHNTYAENKLWNHFTDAALEYSRFRAPHKSEELRLSALAFTAMGESKNQTEKVEMCLNELINAIEFTDLTDISEVREYLSFALSIATFHTRKGQFQFSLVAERIYRLGLKRKIWETNGKIPMAIYKNVVSLMIRLKKADWAEEFAEEYREKLAGKDAKAEYVYNRGLLLFERKQFHKAIELLYQNIAETEFTPTLYFSRIYLCRAFWEINDFELMHSMLESTRQFLRRIRFGDPDQKERYHNYLKFMRKVGNAMTLPTKDRDHALTKLIFEIDSSPKRIIYAAIREMASSALQR